MQYTSEEFFNAIDLMKDASTRLEEDEVYLPVLDCAVYILNQAVKTHFPGEFYAEVRLSPVALGQLLMEAVSVDDPVNKKFWLQVAEHMGPDYAQAFYHAAVFTTKVA